MGSAKMRRLSSAPSNYLHHNQTCLFSPHPTLQTKFLATPLLYLLLA